MFKNQFIKPSKRKQELPYYLIVLHYACLKAHDYAKKA